MQRAKGKGQSFNNRPNSCCLQLILFPLLFVRHRTPACLPEAAASLQAGSATAQQVAGRHSSSGEHLRFAILTLPFSLCTFNSALELIHRPHLTAFLYCCTICSRSQKFSTNERQAKTASRKKLTKLTCTTIGTIRM